MQEDTKWTDTCVMVLGSIKERHCYACGVMETLIIDESIVFMKMKPFSCHRGDINS